MNHTWTDAEYTYQETRVAGGGKHGFHSVVLTFKDEQEAKDFARQLNISKDVDEELRNYGEGVLRTVARGVKRYGRQARRVRGK
jgi:hypothetical protein